MPTIKLKLPQAAYDALSAYIAETRRPRQLADGTVEVGPLHTSVEDYVTAIVRDAAGLALRQRPSGRVQALMTQIAEKQAELETELQPVIEVEK